MDVLIIDDDAALCRSLQIHLARQKHNVKCAQSGEDGVALAREHAPELAFVDVQLPQMGGLDVLRALREAVPEVITIVITGTQDSRATVESVQLGAFDYIRKPLDLDQLTATLERAAHHLALRNSRTIVPIPTGIAGNLEFVGSDTRVIEALKQVGKLSRTKVPVLIQGESGTGKELVARLLHESSGSGRPFVAINSSAVVPTLLESELFGHDKGAFTGAASSKPGKLELAGDGTFFLDEIGEMPVELQAKLLRAVQERSFERVGGMSPIPLNARIVTATNRDLQRLIQEGRFREDLYFRLAVSTITLPPLRERRGEIPLIVDHILAQVKEDLGCPLRGVERSVMKHLIRYDWPGNVRELRNVLIRAAVLSEDNVIAEDLILDCLYGAKAEASTSEDAPLALKEVEKRHIRSVLEMSGWNISKSASMLGISRVTLRKKILDFKLRDGALSQNHEPGK